MTNITDASTDNHDLGYFTARNVGWARKRDTNAATENTDEYLKAAKSAAIREGYKPVGQGNEPADSDVVLLPTCSSSGFYGRCEKIYFSRWYRSN